MDFDTSYLISTPQNK